MWRARRVSLASGRVLERIGESPRLDPPNRMFVSLTTGQRLNPFSYKRNQLLVPTNRQPFSTRTAERESYDEDATVRPQVLEITVSRQQKQDQDLRYLFHTLKGISTLMPKKLAAVGGDMSDDLAAVTAISWRDAAALEEYRDGSLEHWNNNSRVRSDEKVDNIGVVDDSWEAEMENAIVSNLKGKAAWKDRHTSQNLHGKKHMEEYNPKIGPSSALSEDVALTDEQYDHESLVKGIEEQLSAAIQSRQVDIAIELFELATVQHGLEVSLDIVHDLFRSLTVERPFHSYQLLQYIIQRTNTCLFANNSDEETSTEESQQIGELYQRMCFALRVMDPAKMRHGDIRSLVASVISDLRQLNEDVGRMCWPVLVSSLVEQRSSNVGRWASHYYKHMAAMEYELPPDYFLNLLTFSKYNRQKDLPYHDVLRQVVQAGRKPAPQIVMNAVENMFPYTENIEGTYIALKNVMELQQQSRQMVLDQENDSINIRAQLQEQQDGKEVQRLKKRLKRQRRPNSYILDVSTLEAMGAAAAGTGCVELNLLLWDALDLMGHEPTESVYENTIVCFAKSADLCENAFLVLKDMEESGFEPSRALIKSFAVALRRNRDGLQFASNMLQSFLLGESHAVPFTPSGLNVLMAAHAERGSVETTINMLHEFDRLGWDPTVDSYSFALEAVGKATGRMMNNAKLRMAPEKKNQVIESYMAMVDSILTQMETPRGPSSQPVTPTKHVIRNYVEFLCLANHVETATHVVTDFLEKQEGSGQLNVIDNKTILRVVIANAEHGNFELAKKLAASTSESLQFLDAKIEKIHAESLTSAEQTANDNATSNV